VIRSLMLGASLLLASPHVVRAQDTTALVSDRAANAELSKIIESARSSGLPVEPLLAKIGYAVNIAHAPPARIVAAVRATAARLQEAREALAPNPNGIDIAAGGNALSANVSPKSLQDIRKASGNRSVAVPLGVLTQLVVNKVDEKKATKFVVDLIRQGATADNLIAFGNGVNSDVQAGTKPNLSAELRVNGLTAVLGVPTAASAVGDALTAGASTPPPPGRKKP
jgi:hypothetical protein